MAAIAQMEYQRISRTAEIVVDALVQVAFPLFDPVNEMNWVRGWTPRFIYPTDFVTQEQAIFITPCRFDNEEDYHWVITKFIPDQYHVEYMVSTRERIWWIEVKCISLESNQTKASITYQFTGLTENGNNLNRIALAKMYQHELIDWQEAINHYLLTGSIYHPDFTN